MKASERYLVEDVSCELNGKQMAVANLSVGGLFVASDDPPIQGQVVALEIRLQGREPFVVHGQVSWINAPDQPKAPGLPQGFGVKITRVAFPDKLAILDFLKRRRAGARIEPPSRLTRGR